MTNDLGHIAREFASRNRLIVRGLPEVKAVLSALEDYGIHLLDVNRPERPKKGRHFNREPREIREKETVRKLVKIGAIRVKAVSLRISSFVLFAWLAWFAVKRIGVFFVKFVSPLLISDFGLRI